jgi:hypothetical protein
MTGSPRRLKRFYVFSAVVLLLPGVLHAGSEWKLVNDAEGIKSYTRTAEGSPIAELKALTVVDAKMEAIGEVLRDIHAYPEWQKSCKDAKVLEKIGPDDFIMHIIINLPVVADRDVVVKSTAVRDLERARTNIVFGKIDRPDVQSPPRVEKMKEFSGSYLLEYITRDRTGVIYTYKADPGKSIPPWMVNLFGKKVLHQTLKGLKEMVKREKYIKQAEESPDRGLIDGIRSEKAKVREILRKRLSEQIGDAESVERMMQDEELVSLFVEGDGEIAKTIFMASGSLEAKKEAARSLLKIHLKKFTKDQKLIDKAAASDAVVTAIITGNKKDGKTATQMLEDILSR